MTYPIIMNGEHAEFEATYTGKPEDRPDWPLPSFDARDWAKEFCRIATELGYAKGVKAEPIDEGWMVTWFANALMRGYDERSSKQPRTSDIREAVARGWCTPANSNKEIDSDLAEAIVQEILLCQP